MAPSVGRFCAETRVENAEPLAATASRVDHWILVEYRGLWAHDAVAGERALGRGEAAPARAGARARPHTKLLFVRRPSAAARPGSRGVLGQLAGARRRELFHAELDGYDDLLGLDLDARAGEPVGHPLLLVCTHGKHDRCCARYGRPLYDALARAGRGRTGSGSPRHIGGDRFAGNVVFLPEGLYFGRVEPGEAWPVLDEYLAGRIHLEHYRGRSCYPFAEQAAERAVREATGLRGIDDLELVEHDGSHIASAPAVAALRRRRHATSPASSTYLTCYAGALRHPRHYAAGILRESVA